MTTATHIVIAERRTLGRGTETRSFVTTATAETLAENFRDFIKRWIAETGYYGDKDRFRVVGAYQVAGAVDATALEASFGRAIGMHLAEERPAAVPPVATPEAVEDREDGDDHADEDREDEDAGVAMTDAAKADLLTEMAEVLEGRRRWDRRLGFDTVIWALLDADLKRDAQGIAYALEHVPYSTFRDDYDVGSYVSSLDGSLLLARKLGHPAVPLMASAVAGLGDAATDKDITRGFLARLLRAEIARLTAAPQPGAA